MTGNKQLKSRRNAQGSNISARTVRAPVAQQKRRKMGTPSVSQRSNGNTLVVKHREFLRDIIGTAAFASVSVPVNPGLTNSFPWLSKIARNFESYRFRKLHFEYDTMVSTDTDGVAMLVMDYDAADAAPGSKLEAMSYLGSERGPLWAPTLFKANQASLNKLPQRYVRFSSLASNLDIKTYDAGVFYLCTVGSSTTGTIGELYVDYEVELSTPQYSIAAVEVPQTVTFFNVNPSTSTPNFLGASGEVNNVGSDFVFGATTHSADQSRGTSPMTFRQIGRYLLSGFYQPRTSSVTYPWSTSGFMSDAGIALNGGYMTYVETQAYPILQWFLDITVNRPNSILNIVVPALALGAGAAMHRQMAISTAASTLPPLAPVPMGSLRATEEGGWFLPATQLVEPEANANVHRRGLGIDTSRERLMSPLRDYMSPN